MIRKITKGLFVIMILLLCGLSVNATTTGIVADFGGEVFDGVFLTGYNDVNPVRVGTDATWGDFSRQIVDFNVSSIPAGSTINSVTLQLTKQSENYAAVHEIRGLSFHTGPLSTDAEINPECTGGTMYNSSENVLDAAANDVPVNISLNSNAISNVSTNLDTGIFSVCIRDNNEGVLAVDQFVLLYAYDDVTPEFRPILWVDYTPAATDNLMINITEPAGDINVSFGSLFNVTANVSCSGYCGSVNASLDPISHADTYEDVVYSGVYEEEPSGFMGWLRYIWKIVWTPGNLVTGMAVGELINTTIGAHPFYTFMNNPVDYNDFGCLENMPDGSSCEVYWTVNATNKTGIYEFFAFVNSTNTTATSDESEHFNVTLFNIKSASDINLLVNGVDGDVTVGVNDNVNIQSFLNNGEGNTVILIDGVVEANTTNATYTASFNKSGTYNITAKYYGNIDYNESQEEHTVTVNNAPPLVTEQLPLDTDFRRNDFNFTFNYTDTDGDIDVQNCSLFVNINGSGWIRNATTATPSQGFIVYPVGANTEDTVRWYVNCTDNSGDSGVSGIKTVFVDSVNPIPVYVYPLVDNGTTHTTNTFNLDIKVEDSNLKNATIRIIDPSSSEVYSAFDNVSLGVEQIDFSTSLDVSSWQNGNYLVSMETGNDYAGNSRNVSRSFVLNLPSTPPDDDGGGGGGSWKKCREDWICDDWSRCGPDGEQDRDCRDFNRCEELFEIGTVDEIIRMPKPDEERDCKCYVDEQCKTGFKCYKGDCECICDNVSWVELKQAHRFSGINADIDVKAYAYGNLIGREKLWFDWEDFDYRYENPSESTRDLMIREVSEEGVTFVLDKGGVIGSDVEFVVNITEEYDNSLILPEDGKLKVTLEKASAALMADLYLAEPHEELLIEDSLTNIGTVTETTYDYGTELVFFVRIDGRPWRLGVYEHYSNGYYDEDTPYCITERINKTAWRLRFEDLPGYRADWDYNDVVALVELIPIEKETVSETRGYSNTVPLGCTQPLLRRDVFGTLKLVDISQSLTSQCFEYIKELEEENEDGDSDDLGNYEGYNVPPKGTKCRYGWDCGPWSQCNEEGKQYRECVDMGDLFPSEYCMSIAWKPDEERNCNPAYQAHLFEGCRIPWVLIVLFIISYVMLMIYAYGYDKRYVKRDDAQQLINSSKMKALLLFLSGAFATTLYLHPCLPYDSLKMLLFTLMLFAFIVVYVYFENFEFDDKGIDKEANELIKRAEKTDRKKRPKIWYKEILKKAKKVFSKMDKSKKARKKK